MKERFYFMRFEDWVPYMKQKSFLEKLYEFGTTSERIEYLIYKESRGLCNGLDNDTIHWYSEEIKNQRKRQEWLYQELQQIYNTSELKRIRNKKRGVKKANQ